VRADAARNHERIVGAAVQAFEEIGPQVTLEEIAARANVSVMTVYRRFRARDQLVQAVFDHVLTTELEPVATVRTDDPWRDLVGMLEAVTEVLARRRVIISLAHEFEAFAAESTQRFLHAIEPVLHRAIDAGVVRPELLPRDVTAITVMAMAMVHPGDPDGEDRRRYLALLIDGLRPSPTTLPPPSPHEFSRPVERTRRRAE
jgi:AcrR family transcriptional regulator